MESVTHQSKAPYWRLSGFYFFYFTSLGAMLPYWGLYLKHLNYDAAAIGSLMAIIMATKIISPNIWGWIADHTGKRMSIVRLGSLFAALSFVGVFWQGGYWWLVIVMVVFSFFWNAALPQFEATTFHHLKNETHRYSSIRLWGSIGFIVAVWCLGYFLEGEQIRYLPILLVILFSSIWLISIFVPEEAAGHLSIDHQPLSKILTRPHVVGLFIVCFLMQASHGPYYTFYSIYMESYDYSLSVIGGLWALGVIAEVGVFLLMHRMVPIFGLRNLLLSSLLLAAIRWFLIGMFPEVMPVMFIAQLLHAASFGIYHAAAIHLIHEYFSGSHQGKGQALYSSISFGAGGALGSFLSGYTYDYLGPAVMFYGAAISCLVAFIVAWKWVYER